jgi:hypothetical protein
VYCVTAGFLALASWLLTLFCSLMLYFRLPDSQCQLLDEMAFFYHWTHSSVVARNKVLGDGVGKSNRQKPFLCCFQRYLIAPSALMTSDSFMVAGTLILALGCACVLLIDWLFGSVAFRSPSVFLLYCSQKPVNR